MSSLHESTFIHYKILKPFHRWKGKSLQACYRWKRFRLTAQKPFKYQHVGLLRKYLLIMLVYIWIIITECLSSQQPSKLNYQGRNGSMRMGSLLRFHLWDTDNIRRANLLPQITGQFDGIDSNSDHHHLVLLVSFYRHKVHTCI